MPKIDSLRQHLSRLLEWEEAHVGLETSVKGLPARLRGRRPKGFPHSPWELLEHIRLAQRDLLDFCRDPDYASGAWPDDYWPKSPEPPNAASWKKSLAVLRADRKAFQRFVRTAPDLLAAIPHGEGKTYLRSVLLAADHASYHVGQLVMARQLLGTWPPS